MIFIYEIANCSIYQINIRIETTHLQIFTNYHDHCGIAGKFTKH